MSSVEEIIKTHSIEILEGEKWAYPPHTTKILVSTEGRAYSLRYSKFIGIRNQDGYIRIYINKRKTPLHRVIYETFVGPIPNGMLIRHLNDIRDDNRVINLKIGNYRDNYLDSIKNGSKPHSRINKNIADKVIDLRNEGKTYNAICLETGLIYRDVKDILQKGIWTDKSVTFDCSANFKIKEKDYETIYQMRLDGKTYKEIGDVFGISVSYVYGIFCGNNHPRFYEEFGYKLDHLKRKTRANATSSLSEECVEEIFRLNKANLSQREIGRRLDINYKVIHAILKGKYKCFRHILERFNSEVQ